MRSAGVCGPRVESSAPGVGQWTSEVAVMGAQREELSVGYCARVKAGWGIGLVDGGRVSAAALGARAGAALGAWAETARAWNPSSNAPSMYAHCGASVRARG